MPGALRRGGRLRAAVAAAWLTLGLAPAWAQPGPPGVGGLLNTGEASEPAAEEAEAPAGETRQGDLGSAPTALSVEADVQTIDRQLSVWEETAREAEAAITAGDAAPAIYEGLRQRLVDQREAAKGMSERLLAAMQPLRRQLEALGEGPDSSRSLAPPPPERSGEEDALPDTRSENAVSAERRELAARLEALESRQRRAELAFARAATLIGEIDRLIRQRFVDQLLALGPTPLDPLLWGEAVQEGLGLAIRAVEEVQANADSPELWREAQVRLPLLVGGLVLGGALLTLGRRAAVRAIYRRLEADAGRGRRIGLGAAAALARVAAPAAGLLLVWGAVDQSGLLGPRADVLLRYAVAGGLMLVGARGIAAAFYAPDAPLLRLSSLDDAKSVVAARRALGVGGALFFYMTVVRGGEAAELSSGALAVFNLVILIGGAASLWMLARSVGPQPVTAPVRTAEDNPLEEFHETAESVGRKLAGLSALGMRVSAVVSVGLALSGYYAASQFAFYPLVVSLGVIALGVLVHTLLKEAVEAYLESKAEVGNLRLLPVLVGFVITVLTLPVLAIIWGARGTDLLEAWRFVVEGAEVGGVRISPAGFLTFVAVFGLGYALTRFLQVILSTSVLPNTRMDAGGRSAVTAGIGYAGFVVALLMGIGAAGLDLSSIAIVAGALSVGIGFGLQNIVNNFVSGIILLVERPIKVGDWIYVGGTHGVVKRVAVRATEIETFDKSSLILPNSELISGTVVNYTLGNSAGRLILKVRVAYGTDLKGVERILLDIAAADRRILRYPAPLVLFVGFGENGVEFELRVILRDVNQIFHAQTDLYFEIERRLREAGVVIPFAQRVLHLADPQALGEALRGHGQSAPRAQDLRAGLSATSGPGEGETSPGRSPGAPGDGDGDAV